MDRTWKMTSGGMTSDQLLEALKGRGIKVRDQARALIQSRSFETSEKRSERFIDETYLGAMYDGTTNPKNWGDIMHRTFVGRVNKISPEEVVHFALQVSEVEMRPDDWFVAVMFPLDLHAFTIKRLRDGGFELGAIQVHLNFGMIYRKTMGIIRADPRIENQDKLPWLGRTTDRSTS